MACRIRTDPNIKLRFIIRFLLFLIDFDLQQTFSNYLELVVTNFFNANRWKKYCEFHYQDYPTQSYKVTLLRLLFYFTSLKFWLY